MSAVCRDCLLRYPDKDPDHECESQITVNLRGKDGFTPLHRACCEGDVELVKALLRRNDIDVNRSTSWGQTALHVAVSQKQAECVRLLLEHPMIDMMQRKWDQPALFACANPNLLRLFLKSGINLTTRDERGNVLLHFACRFGNLECVQMLLEGDGTVTNLLGEWGTRTPLMMACEEGAPECVAVLLAHPNIDVNLVTSEGHCALYFSICRRPSVACLKLLLARPEIRVNVRGNLDDRGKGTVLSWAITSTDQKIFAVLMARDDITPSLGQGYFNLEQRRVCLPLPEALKNSVLRPAAEDWVMRRFVIIASAFRHLPVLPTLSIVKFDAEELGYKGVLPDFGVQWERAKLLKHTKLF